MRLPQALTGAMVALAALSSAAQAITRQEAAASNILLAMTVCLQNYQTPANILTSLQAAGFSYSPEDFGGGPEDILHWHYDPSQTMSAAIVITQTQVECRIGTREWDVNAMLPFATEAFGVASGGIPITPGSPEGENILPGSAAGQQRACSGFHVLLPRSLMWAQISNEGQDPTCISDGTSVIRMIF